MRPRSEGISQDIQKHDYKSAKKIDGEMSHSIGTAKCPYGEMSMRRNAGAAKCPYGEMSIRRNIHTAKCPYGEMSYGEISYGEMSHGEMSYGDMSVHGFYLLLMTCCNVPLKI